MILVSFICLVMMNSWRFVSSCEHYDDSACQDIDPIKGDYFMNQWIINLHHGSEEEAKKIAEDNNLQYLGKVKDHDDAFILSDPTIPQRHKMVHEGQTEFIKSHPLIKMAEQHYVYQPTIRDLENYTDMVGYEKAQVKISHFNPNELEEENKITVPTDNYKDPEVFEPLSISE